MFVATLNKTLKSYIFAIVMQNIYCDGFIGTHEWENFKPEDLISIQKKNLFIEKVDGMKLIS